MQGETCGILVAMQQFKIQDLVSKCHILKILYDNLFSCEFTAYNNFGPSYFLLWDLEILWSWGFKLTEQASHLQSADREKDQSAGLKLEA
jgi:hypothetical protein